ncbi:MAG: F0F1 ATP synthase subunit B' [Alphaproteobacteria bacterium]|nr:F0F1 ATP synthase subunit B' [Alphaproteobacteria bacterium]
MRGRILAGALALAALSGVAATALAAEGHGGGGMPQLDATKFAPQLIWLAITFAVLYVLMARVALPRVSEVLEARADHVNDDLRRAEEARGEAEAVMQAYEKALAEARSKAMAEAKAATDVITAAAEARQKEAEAALAGQMAASDAEILTAKGAAMANVRSVAAEVAIDATRRIGGFDVDPARARAAVDAVLGG